MRRLEDLGFVAFHFPGQLTLLFCQRGNTHLGGTHLGADTGRVEAYRGHCRSASPTGFERLDLAFDRHDIRVGVLVAGQQLRVFGFQAWQVFGQVGTG
ncbi:hypothetical protein D3C75_1135040 [compost metagenome]